MLIIIKYIVLTLLIFILLFSIAYYDIIRQGKLAENYTLIEVNRILTSSIEMNKYRIPSSMFNKEVKKIDTNYLLSQWEIAFTNSRNEFIQVFVEPDYVVFIPILNFKNNFKISRLNYIVNNNPEK